MSLDNTTPSPLDELVAKPLTEQKHDDPELHFIGSSVLKPTTVSEVIAGGSGFVGVLPSPAREDHVHGMASTGSAPPVNMDDVVGGILDVQYGGTGKNTLLANSYIKGNGTLPVVDQPTPIPVSDGGTGATFFTPGQVLLGNGTGPITTGGSAARRGFALRRVANQSVVSGASSGISWDTEDEDSGGWVTVPSLNIVVPTGISGVFIARSLLRIEGTGGFQGSLNNHHYILHAAFSGGQEFHGMNVQNTSVINDGANSWSSVDIGPVQVNPGDTFQVRLRHDSGAARNVVGSFRGWIVLP